MHHSFSFGEPRHDSWAEATNTAWYLHSGLLSRSCRRRRTPCEIINNRRLSPGQCKIFGSRAYVFKHKRLRQGKYDSRADVRMLVGYDRRHVYRVLLDENDTMVVSQDVMIMELKEKKDRNAS